MFIDIRPPFGTTMNCSLPWLALHSPRFMRASFFPIGDTDYYAAIQTEWPMLRPPVTLDVHIKETCPAPVTLTAAMLLVT